MPEISLSLPAALGLLVLLVAIGAALVFFLTKGKTENAAIVTTPTLSPTVSATVTLTPTITLTPSPQPTATPLPPIEYTIGQGDSCTGIAAFFKVSVNSIILLNNLPAACNTLIAGTKLLVPQPTPTALPEPSSTPNPSQATEQACEKVEYTVKESDTLSTIASTYAVSMESIKQFNGLVNDVVYSGFTLIIPLCERVAPGTTPTPTVPPPYAAPNLLLPAGGAPFNASDVITLQWSSVGSMRTNEAYAVTAEDVTEGKGRKLVEYVTDTKFNLPVSFRPADAQPHLIQWWVLPVRQIGTSNDGQPIWSPAGTVSEKRGLIWIGGPAAAASPTP
jgi:LysM repeat protein